MKKRILIILGLLALILTQCCDWYVQYQPYKEVSYQELPQIVKDSIMSEHWRYNAGVVLENGTKIYNKSDIISVDGKYLFCTKPYFWSPAGGSWIDYYYIINKDNGYIHKLQSNTSLPCITYNDSLYVQVYDINWFNYNKLDTAELKFRRYKLDF